MDNTPIDLTQSYCTRFHGYRVKNLMKLSHQLIGLVFLNENARRGYPVIWGLDGRSPVSLTSRQPLTEAWDLAPAMEITALQEAA